MRPASGYKCCSEWSSSLTVQIATSRFEAHYEHTAELRTGILPLR
jgi:hypothetical protein